MVGSFLLYIIPNYLFLREDNAKFLHTFADSTSLIPLLLLLNTTWYHAAYEWFLTRKEKWEKILYTMISKADLIFSNSQNDVLHEKLPVNSRFLRYRDGGSDLLWLLNVSFFPQRVASFYAPIATSLAYHSDFFFWV